MIGGGEREMMREKTCSKKSKNGVTKSCVLGNMARLRIDHF